MEKKKGPAPPPPSLPNSNAATGPKESDDEKVIPEAIPTEEIENKPNQKEISESPTSPTPPEEISSQREVRGQFTQKIHPINIRQSVNPLNQIHISERSN